MKKKAALHNLGCKVNAYETEAMQELLEQNGYEIVPFKEGADGVFVAGCHMGDCHYDAGNYKLDRRMRLIYKLVEDMGIGKERVHHDWISASEGEKFSEAVKMMVNRIKELGPAPLKEQLDAEN